MPTCEPIISYRNLIVYVQTDQTMTLESPPNW